jgi:hypothetical protein
MSATHKRSEPAGRNSRRTRSAAEGASFAGTVVFKRFLPRRETPAIPRSRINRATRLAPDPDPVLVGRARRGSAVHRRSAASRRRSRRSTASAHRPVAATRDRGTAMRSSRRSSPRAPCTAGRQDAVLSPPRSAGTSSALIGLPGEGNRRLAQDLLLLTKQRHLTPQPAQLLPPRSSAPHASRRRSPPGAPSAAATPAPR